MRRKARRMRRDKGPAERKLWRSLRELNAQGYHFRQQAPIGSYIADFAELSKRLIVEVDGSQHGLDENMRADQLRSAWLNSQGFRVQRFWNHDVLANIDGVMTQVLLAIGHINEPVTRFADAISEKSISEKTPPHLWGKLGGGESQLPAVRIPPTPNPSPQGGGGFATAEGAPSAQGGEVFKRGFSHIETWIFDLDNTLYPASCDLFAQVDHRMGDFIAKNLGVPYAHARHLQKAYYRQFGTTLAGLMKVHKLKPEPFLEYVHDIDLSVLPHLPELADAIARLPGRKLIFTNGSRRHAENVAAKIGVLHLFEGICDIAALGFVPKPERSAFDLMARQHNVTPDLAAMFEDMPHNLEAPHAMGMTTVLVKSDFIDHPVQLEMRKWRELPAHVHHSTDDLTGFIGKDILNLPKPTSHL